MAHNLNFNVQTGKHSFFSVKEKAWHGLGQIVEDYPTSAEALKFALQSFGNLVRDDNLFIFFAGHGEYINRESIDQSEGYWIFSDDSINHKRRATNTEIKTYIKLIPSGHTLLISDACFSGSFVHTEVVSQVFSIQKTNVDYYHDRSRQVISSTRLTTTPDNSEFFKNMIGVLKDNKQHYFSTTELFANVCHLIANQEIFPLYGRLPEAGDASGSFIFIKNK